MYALAYRGTPGIYRAKLGSLKTANDPKLKKRDSEERITYPEQTQSSPSDIIRLLDRLRWSTNFAKMTTEERTRFYLKALEEQRHLLRTAIGGMATGDLTQAMNVATRIRVLVHESGSSKPLLKCIQRNYLDLPILDRVMEPPKEVSPGVRSVTFYCPVSAIISGAGIVSLKTDLDSPDYRASTLGAWWNNACMVLPGLGPFARKELILGLTNKEGGAHVDPDITERYKLVLESKFVQFHINDIDVGPLNVSRLVAGKAGVELLDCLDKGFPCGVVANE